jgi:hypothetical protein
MGEKLKTLGWVLGVFWSGKSDQKPVVFYIKN